jgi:hypothetical protein
MGFQFNRFSKQMYYPLCLLKERKKTNELFHIVRFWLFFSSSSSSSSSSLCKLIEIIKIHLFNKRIYLYLFFYSLLFSGHSYFLVRLNRLMSLNNSKRSIQSSSNSDTSPLKKKTKIALKRSFNHSSSSDDDIDIPVV